MKEYKCIKCHKLLCKISENSVGFMEKMENIFNDGLDENLMPKDLEVKCGRCKKLNKINIFRTA